MKKASPFPLLPEGLRYLEGEAIHFKFTFNNSVGR